MITTDEIVWLKQNLPTLDVSRDHQEISGSITFTASYDRANNIFISFADLANDDKGEILNNTYTVIIKKHYESKRLPVLKVNIEHDKRTSNRHFNQNGHACLCGPIEEVDFFEQEFSFLRYLDRLVIPFLYGQTFYDQEGKWPWKEFSHGAAGALQSFNEGTSTIEHAKTCIKQLQTYDTWPRIKDVLLGKERVMEMSRCFCPNPRNIKKCCPSAWFGIIKLREYLKQHPVSMKLPQQIVTVENPKKV